MKKVFIYAYNLELGGIERSLIGLLESFNKDEYLVDLFLAKHEGFIYESLMRIVAKVVNKALRFLKNDNTIAIESFIYHKFIISRMKGQRREYDMAVSFAMPYFYVLNKVHANVKIGFIHTDYSRVNINFKFVRKMFDRIDYIASVSESVRESLLNSITMDSNKTIVIENIMPVKSMDRAASAVQHDMPDDGAIRLLSIGRFGEAKNFDNVPFICKRIVENGQNVKWYLIGFGNGESLIRQRIKESDTENRVIILGKRENPYSYISDCDLYVQPSRYEGKAVTVREAQMLGKPVVITNFPTSKSQLKDGYDGLIVPLDNDKCADAISELLRDRELMNRLSENCRSSDYTNYNEVQKLYSILDNSN